MIYSKYRKVWTGSIHAAKLVHFIEKEEFLIIKEDNTWQSWLVFHDFKGDNENFHKKQSNFGEMSTG